MSSKRFYWMVACLAALTLALAASPGSAATTYTWTQTVGGAQNWTTGGNWDGGSVPSPVSGDTVDFSTVDILADTTLTLGANRTATTWKFGDTSGSQTWAVSGNTNTLTLVGTGANLDVATATRISSVLAVANGTSATATGSGALTLDNVAFKVGGTAANTTQTLNLSGLGSFTYNNSGGAFSVGGQLSGNYDRTIGTLTLSADSTITASTFGVANISNGGNSTESNNTNLGTLKLKGSTTINTGAITVGAAQANGVIQYVSGTTNPTLKIRGTNGEGAAATMLVGQGNGNGNGYTMSSSVDLVTGATGSILDAWVGTLTIGHCNRTSTATGNGGTVNGTFTMGAGTLTATTIVLGSTTAYGNTSNSQTVNGTFTTGAGGVVKVGTLKLVNQINNTGTVNLTGTFNFSGGADLYATTIGPGSTTSGTVTRTFNWNNGTIHNLEGTDLTINSGVTWTLLTTGTHAFDIDDGRTGTVNAVLAGTAGALTKTGAGTLTLNGLNTYTVATTVRAGTLIAGRDASSNVNGAFGKATSAITLGDANTASNTVSLLTGGNYTIGRPVTVANYGSDTTIGGNTDIDSTFSGAITLNKALTVSQAASAGANALSVTGGISSGGGDQTVTFAGPGNINVTTTAIANGSSGGTMAVAVTGGTTTFSVANTYTGATNVNGGTLLVNGSGSLHANSAVTVAAGATLGGTGTIGGTVTVNETGHLSPGPAGAGSAGVGTLHVGSLELKAGSVLDYYFSTPDDPEFVAVANALTLPDNGKVMLNLSGTIAVGNVFDLMQYGTIANFDLDRLKVASPDPDLTYIFGTDESTSTKYLRLTIGSASTTVNGSWTGQSDPPDTLWGTQGNWLNNKVPISLGDSAAFSGTAGVSVSLGTNRTLTNLAFGPTTSGAAGYTLSDNTLTLGSSEVAATVEVTGSGSHTIGSDVTLEGNTSVSTAAADSALTVSGNIGGSGLLTKTGIGSLTLSGSNNYGGTVVSGGTLVIASAGALPAGRSLSIGSGGTLILGGGMAMGTAASAEPVPEPCTLALLAIVGLAGVMIYRVSGTRRVP